MPTNVLITSHNWSGFSIPASLEAVPAIGETIHPWIHSPNATDESKKAEYVVCGRRRETICSHCGSRTPKGDAIELVIHVATERDRNDPDLKRWWQREYND